MKKKMKSKWMVAWMSLVILVSGTTACQAEEAVSEEDVSKELVTENTSYEILSIEEMMEYAILDEYAAKGEYDALMAEFGERNPFLNIRDAETTHIEWLEALYQEMNMDIPDIDVSDRIAVPDSIQEALEIGVEAEIANIQLYKDFIEQGVPENVQEVFEALIAGSENHLVAFQRALDGNGIGGNRSGGNSERGNRGGNGRNN